MAVRTAEQNNTRMTMGLFSSRTEEWETPQYVYDNLNIEFQFTLDVCATYDNAKCRNYYTKERDGLNESWFLQTCWMNPPYGKNIGKWMQKAYNESTVGSIVVCLIPARTDTKWWREWAMKASEIRFIRGRLKFGDGKQSAPFPSCIVIFDSRENKQDAPIIRTTTFISGNNGKP